MTGLEIMLLAQAVPAVAQLVTGGAQGIKGKRMGENLQDPFRYVPKSANEALNLARQNTTSRYMSGYDNLQNRVNQGSASAMGEVMRTARSPQEALAALAAINSSTQEKQLGLGVQNAQDYERRLGVLGNELDQMAGWEDKVWETNVMEPFLRDSAAASALKNAGINNTYQGLKGITNALGVFGMQGGFTPSRTASEGLTPMTGANNGTIPQLQTPTLRSLPSSNSSIGTPQSILSSTVPTNQNELIGGQPARSVFDSQLDPQTLAALMKAFGQMQQPIIQ